MISTELSKIGFSQSAEECRTKTKSLRKLYKQAVLHNNTSGSGRSKFIWFDEMAQIFRTDTSIHPLHTTESESTAGAETMERAGDVLVTLDLVESNDFLLSAGSDVSGIENLQQQQITWYLQSITSVSLELTSRGLSLGDPTLDNTSCED
ncbi:hypothetical protein JRQ81_004917 [Phrynocephalus forsythii]|uniref:Myb/SANT-like DNA-binding domain-containing protein n=1 Tax=Phrynocephalus forsythii TaxID=171643 RepID=A0A9Q1B6F7_9SAUR|nr:hypothetical protein JRQ81_004917 [Phrynocephalus forsythii]